MTDYMFQYLLTSKYNAMTSMEYLDKEEDEYEFQLVYKCDTKYNRYNSNVILVSDNNDDDNDFISTLDSFICK